MAFLVSSRFFLDFPVDSPVDFPPYGLAALRMVRLDGLPQDTPVREGSTLGSTPIRLGLPLSPLAPRHPGSRGLHARFDSHPAWPAAVSARPGHPVGGEPREARRGRKAWRYTVESLGSH